MTSNFIIALFLIAFIAGETGFRSGKRGDDPLTATLKVTFVIGLLIGCWYLVGFKP